MVSARVKSYAALVLVFLLGALAGAGGAFAFVQHRYADFVRERGATDHWRMTGLTRELELDKAQEEQVRAIVTRHRELRRELTKKMFDECGGSVEQDRMQMDQEIRAVLRPEQQKRWDEVVAKRREHGPGGRPRRPGP
jgi:Spy/CpxP family protein refolding chaperone